MRKFFQLLGLASLISFSFIFTDTTLNVVKEYDELMVTIKNQQKKYKINPIEATIENNTIIPGIIGKQIDINKSYYQMKKLGKFNENLLIYKDIYPKEILDNNLNKYIIRGNKEKKQVSLIFKLYNNVNIQRELQILDKYNVKANFFIDETWIGNDKELELIKKNGHELGNKSDVNSIIIVDTIIKKMLNQQKSYCYYEKENKNKLNLCYMQKDYSIIPSLIIKDNIYVNIKNNISNGSILSLEVNEELQKSLPIIIDFIKSKGYEIVTLNKLLDI